jgi:hypothetical protein
MANTDFTDPGAIGADDNKVVASPILTLINKALCFTVDDPEGIRIFAALATTDCILNLQSSSK